MLVADGAQGAHQFRRGRHETTLADDRLDDDGGHALRLDVRLEQPLDGMHRVIDGHALVRHGEGHVPHARRHGAELGLVGNHLAGQRHAKQRAAMEAAVEGDDVMALAHQVQWAKPLAGRLIGAHAYLGCVPMAEALEDGADVVVTGRVADSALFAAPVRQFLNHDANALAGALTVGHLLECGGQLTGGNYDTFGGHLPGNPLSAADFANLGYPLAHVYADGSADITVLDGAPAILDALTCTLQLLYEVHDPFRYITPDLTLDFSGIRFEQIGPQRIRMKGAKTSGPPSTLKVAGFMELPGFIADCEIGFAGTGAYERAQRAADTLRLRLSDWSDEQLSIDLVGVNSVLRAGSLKMAAPAEVRVHVSAKCKDAEMAQVIEDEIYTLTLSGPAGGCSVRSERRNRIEILDGFIEPSLVKTNIRWSHS